MDRQIIILAVIAGLFVAAGAAHAQVPQVCEHYFGDSVCDDTPANCGANYKAGASYDACRECSTLKDGKPGYANCVSSGSPQTFSGIYAPKGGEQWAAASVQTIQWETSGFSSAANINIFLATRTCVVQSNDGCASYAYPYAATVVNGISNSGTYKWTVQTSIPEGDYFLIICNNDDGCNQRYVAQSSIRIYTPGTSKTNLGYISPFEDEVFRQGAANIIKWSGGKNKVQLALVAPDYYQSGSSGTILGFIKPDGVPDSQVIWNGVNIYLGPNQDTVNYVQPGSGSYRILAISEGPQGGYCGGLGTSICNANLSKGTFTVAATTTSVSLSQPQAGLTFKVGDALPIAWQIQDIPAEADNRVFLQMIRVENGAETNFIQLTADGSAPDSGSFSWTIPSWVSPGTYKIKVKPNCGGPSTLTGCFASAESGLFTIQGTAPQPVNFVVTSPGGGEQWQLGTTKTITWNDPGFTSASSYAIFAEKNTGSVTGIGGVQGATQFAWSVGKVSGSGTTLQAGLYTISVVKQGTPSAQAKSAQFSIVAANQAPEITTIISPASAAVNQQFRIEGVASDNDGTISSISWNIGSNCILTQDAPEGIDTNLAGRKATVKCPNTGLKTFKLSAADNLGSTVARTTSTQIVQQTSDQPLEITITGDQKASLNQQFTLTATATDDNSIKSLALQFVSQGCKVLKANQASGIGTKKATLTLTFSCSSAGDKTITFEATDGVNDAVRTSKIVTINQDQPPTLTVTGVDTRGVGLPFTLIATATDDNERPFLLMKPLPANCTNNSASLEFIGGKTERLTVPITCSSAGQKAITFEATDGTSVVTASKTVAITQSTNQVPKITASSTQTSSILAGQRVLFAWSATDPDNDNLAWSVGWGDGSAEAGTCPSSSPNTLFSRNHSWTNHGTYNITATVSDCKGGSDMTTTFVNVVSQTNQTNNTATCTDSDGGQNIFVRGTVSGRYENGEPYSFDDYCTNSTELIERSCTPQGPGTFQSTLYKCICSDGVCSSEIPPPPPPPGEATFTLSLKKGWNLFSSPVLENPEKLFTEHETDCSYTSPLWRYSKSSRAYQKADALRPMEGHWVRVGGDCSVKISGAEMLTLDELLTDGLELEKGWNVVGAVANSFVKFSNIKGTCTFARGPYWYNPQTLGYEVKEFMEAGKGYIIGVDSDCTMIQIYKPF